LDYSLLNFVWQREAAYYSTLILWPVFSIMARMKDVSVDSGAVSLWLIGQTYNRAVNTLAV